MAMKITSARISRHTTIFLVKAHSSSVTQSLKHGGWSIVEKEKPETFNQFPCNYYFFVLRYSNNHRVEYLHLMTTRHTLLTPNGERWNFRKRPRRCGTQKKMLWPDRREPSAAHKPNSDHNEFRDSTESRIEHHLLWRPHSVSRLQVPIPTIINTIGVYTGPSNAVECGFVAALIWWSFRRYDRAFVNCFGCVCQWVFPVCILFVQ